MMENNSYQDLFMTCTTLTELPQIPDSVIESHKITQYEIMDAYNNIFERRESDNRPKSFIKKIFNIF